MKVYIGVDGGATKTHAVIVNEKREELGSFVSGSSNKNSVGNEGARMNIIEAVQGVLGVCKLTLDDVEGICLGLSGVDRPEDRALVKSWMDAYVPNIRVRIESDPMTNMSSGTLGKMHGMIIIGGTGSICLGTDGVKTHRAGGWGPLLGDVGNGWGIGHDVLVAVARMHDGLCESTMLLDALKQEISIEKADDIIGWTYKDLSWARVAALAVLAIKCATKGDKVSLEILDNHSKGVLDCAKIVAKKMDFTEKFTLVLCGSLLTTEGIFQDIIMKKLKSEFPLAEVTLPKVSPAVGAALLLFEN